MSQVKYGQKKKKNIPKCNKTVIISLKITLTFVRVANEVFDQAAHFSHLLLPRGQRGCCEFGFARLHVFCLLLDITLQKSDMEKNGTHHKINSAFSIY